MTISTQNLDLLPDVPDLKKLLQSLATLDLIMSPEWDYRYYSFNSSWDKNEQMGSMQNGCGDTFFALFNTNGCFFKGFAHEYPMSSWNLPDKTIWPGLLDGVPSKFDGAIAEPAFSMDDISFCFWRINSDSKWEHGPVEFHNTDDPDGSEFLLECLDGNPSTYQDFAEEYYEEDIPLAPIRHIYDHQPITDEVLEMLNPEVSFEDIKDELHKIGYPSP